MIYSDKLSQNFVFVHAPGKCQKHCYYIRIEPRFWAALVLVCSSVFIRPQGCTGKIIAFLSYHCIALQSAVGPDSRESS